MTSLSADVVTKFLTVLWPLARITAAIMTAPVFSAEAANVRVRLSIAIALTLVIYPLREWPVLDPFTPVGIIALLNEIAIGLMTGFALQIVASAWCCPISHLPRGWRFRQSGAGDRCLRRSN